MNSSTPQPTGETRKKYSGEYIGQVVAVDDPDQLLRVRVRVKDVFDNVPEKDLPWATYKLPVGSRSGDGLFIPVDPGDWVWVDFPFGGDTRHPRITGSVHYCPGGTPNFPPEAYAGADSYSHKRTGPQVMPTAAAYHRDVVFNQHGVLVEVVSGTGEVRVTQRGSGSAVEIDRDGNITAHSEANLYGSATDNCQLDVVGDLTVNVGENIIMEAGGNVTIIGSRIDLNP